MFYVGLWGLVVGDSVIVGMASVTSFTVELGVGAVSANLPYPFWTSFDTQFLNPVVLEVAGTTLIASRSIILVGKLAISRVIFLVSVQP